MAKTATDIILLTLLALSVVGSLMYGIVLILPEFVKSKLRRFLNGAVFLFGLLSPVSLFVIWAAAHDISYDYVSSRLYSQAGTTLPGWYDPSVNSCFLEWTASSVAFLVLILFHALLFVRFLVAKSPTTL